MVGHINKNNGHMERIAKDFSESKQVNGQRSFATAVNGLFGTSSQLQKFYQQNKNVSVTTEGAMPLFYFHIRDGPEVYADLRGRHFDDLEEAEEYAIKVARKMAEGRSLPDLTARIEIECDDDTSFWSFRSELCTLLEPSITKSTHRRNRRCLILRNL